MIVCSRCGKENQDHYKFCLGCGAELAAQLQPDSDDTSVQPENDNTGAGNAETMHADETMLADGEGVYSGLADGEGVYSGDGAEAFDSNAPANGTEHTDVQICPECGAHNPAAFMFCGGCGGRLQPTGEEPVATPSDNAQNEAAAPKLNPQEPSHPEPRQLGRLALIRPDGTADGAFDLDGDDVVIGRGTGPMFDHDGYLSPTHARIFRQDNGTIMVEDVESANGVFMRITGEETLESGQMFRIGQELLRFDAIGKPKTAKDGTYVLGSPNPGYWGRLSLLVGRGIDGSAFPLMGDEMVLGRERGDILFSDDGYVSSAHVKLTLGADGAVRLVDLGSSNGTFIRLDTPRTIVPGTFILLGQQLFRFEAV